MRSPGAWFPSKRHCGALAALLACAQAPAGAQCEGFGPLGPGFRASQALFYDQVWSQVARTQTGYLAVWSEGQNVVLRRYDANLVPSGSDTLVNATLNLDIQDEPAVAVASGGNQLIAWSDRHGYDGEQMGIYGRLYGSTGAPLGPEFKINQISAASQWRPLIAPTPAGGFVVTWSGDWEGNAYFRVLSATGAMLTGDVRINQYAIDAQVDPAVAVASNGRIFAVFVDFSSGTSPGGLDLYGRLFDAGGVPLTNEFLLTSPAYSLGHQALPRVAVDGLNRFVVVWQSEGTDGSSTAIVARRFDVNAQPLGTELVVNSTAPGAQLEARVAAEADGDFIVAFEDWSSGVARATCRRFDANAQPKGPDEPVDPLLPNTERVEVIVNPAGSDVVFAYESWGGPDGADVELRRFRASAGPFAYCTAKTSSLGCVPQVVWNGVPSASATQPFTIGATSVISNSPGLLFYGFQSAFQAFQGGTLCVLGPIRTPLQVATGATSSLDCSGAFTLDFNARIQSGIDPQLAPGAGVSAQYYFRDPLDPAGFGSGLSNAIRFTICP